MEILQVSGLNYFNNKTYNYKNANMSVAQQSYKQVTLRDIPYSYPITFKGEKEDMKKTLEDSRWAKEIFEQYGMNAEIDEEDGLIKLDTFTRPDKEHITFQKLDIDVDRLLQNIKEVEGFANFDYYKNISLPNLKRVGNQLDCWGAKDIKFPALTDAKKVDCHNAKDIKFSELTETDEVDCRGAEDIDLSALTKTNKINAIRAKNINISALTQTNDIYCDEAENIDISALTEANYIYCYRAKGINLSALTQANRVDCRYAKNINLYAYKGKIRTHSPSGFCAY